MIDRYELDAERIVLDSHKLRVHALRDRPEVNSIQNHISRLLRNMQ